MTKLDSSEIGILKIFCKLFLNGTNEPNKFDDGFSFVYSSMENLYHKLAIMELEANKEENKLLEDFDLVMREMLKKGESLEND